MRGARLQAQDLTRTSQFVNTLLSKDDVKDMERPEAPEPPKPSPMVNGHGMQFRSDPKTRFSEPPAPPPQQPLPEKPDVPSLKRGPTERPKSGPPNTSPVRQDNLSQIIQLTEALNTAKRDMDTQTARMQELEMMLQAEREKRELAEDLAKRLEESATTHMNGSAKPASPEDTPDDATIREPEPEQELPKEQAAPEADPSVEMASALQQRIDTMDGQMRDIKEQMEQWKQRCEAAEAERDADRKTLAEMVVQLRAEEARRVAAQESKRSRSRRRPADGPVDGEGANITTPARAASETNHTPEAAGAGSVDDLGDGPTLSRANTITPLDARRTTSLQEHRLQAGLPYASMLGVVLIGMGMMAYLNGWESPPPRIEH